MRVAPEELQAVHRAGMLTRYALFGPVVFVAVDLPTGDLSGTGLETPCLTDHHGIVLRGSFGVRHEDGRAEDLPAGTAFYVPPGPPSHTFTSAPRTVVCGFAPVTEPVDDDASALAAAGFDIVGRSESNPSRYSTGVVTMAGAWLTNVVTVSMGSHGRALRADGTVAG